MVTVDVVDVVGNNALQVHERNNKMGKGRKRAGDFMYQIHVENALSCAFEKSAFYKKISR